MIYVGLYFFVDAKAIGKPSAEKKDESQMMKRVLDSQTIARDLEYNCKRKCLTQISVETLKTARYKYWIMKRYEQQIWLMDKISASRCQGRTRIFNIDGGVGVCQSCFMRIYHISRSSYYQVDRSSKCGLSPGISTVKTRKRDPRFLEAMEWFEVYVEFHADRMPHTGQILLPYRPL